MVIFILLNHDTSTYLQIFKEKHISKNMKWQANLSPKIQNNQIPKMLPEFKTKKHILSFMKMKAETVSVSTSNF